MTVWLKAIYSAQKDIICTTKINKNVTRSGWILCLTVIFVYHGWHIPSLAGDRGQNTAIDPVSDDGYWHLERAAVENLD